MRSVPPLFLCATLQLALSAAGACYVDAAAADPCDLLRRHRLHPHNRMLLGVIMLDLFAVLLGGATALLPVYAKDVFEVGSWGLGLLRAAPAAGALISLAVLTAHRLRSASAASSSPRSRCSASPPCVRTVELVLDLDAGAGRSGLGRLGKRRDPDERWCRSRRPTTCAGA